MRFPCWSFILADGRARSLTKMTLLQSRWMFLHRFSDENTPFHVCLRFESATSSSSTNWFGSFYLYRSCIRVFLLNFQFICCARLAVHTWNQQKRSCGVLIETYYGQTAVASDLGSLHSIFATETPAFSFTWHLITQCDKKKRQPQTTMIKNDLEIMKRPSHRHGGHLECIRSGSISTTTRTCVH